MAQQYEIGATGLNGIPYRIEIWNQQYTGSTVTELLADDQMIRFEGGQRERVGLQPIWGKEVRINVRTNEDLSPLFGLEDRDAEVRVFRTDTSSLVWKGFILTDFFQDEPRTALPGVELRAVDGLTTLEGDSFDALSGVSDSDIGEDGSFISYTDLFTGVLSTLYDSPLDVEFAVEWYPDAGGQLTSSDNPLRYSGARPDVYYNSEEGAWFDQQSALEDALKSQGLEIRQSVIGGELTWLVAQPTALSASSVKTWRYAPGGTEDASSPFTRDLSLDLSSADTNRPTREFERRSESVSVTHDHTPIENLVGDDGYEEIGIGNASGWQIDNAATSYIDASILNHDNADASSVGTPDPTPSSLQQDTYVLEVRGSSQNNAVEYPISQDLGDISGIPPETALKFSHQLWHEPFEQQPSNGDQPHLYAELEIGGFYLKEFEAGVRQDVKGGSGTLPVQSLDRAIPNGTKLPLYNRTDSPPDQIPRAFITLSERADKGDTVLVGDISRDVDSKWSVAYLGFTSTAYDFALWRWTKNPNSWGRVEARAFAKDPNGQPLSGNATLRIGGAALYGETNAGSVVDRPAFVDDVTVQLTQEGNELTATTKEGTVSENGQSRDLSVLLSSGPTNKNARRVKGLAPGGSSYQAVDWGIGAGGGSLSLAGLQARERLRYLREHLERQQLTVYARDKSPVVTGEEIVQFDGKTWRVAEFSSDPASGEIGLTLIQHADAGTTDLSIATVRDTEDSGTSGGGGTAPAVGGGGGGVTADAIASALDHDPGLSGGIRTSIRASGSATDDALVTEQAVREALGTVQVDLGDDGTADIAPLKQISVVGDTSGIFSAGDESGELAVDVGKKWPNADQLDGVEGGDYARTDVNETFNEDVTVEGQQKVTEIRWLARGDNLYWKVKKPSNNQTEWRLGQNMSFQSADEDHIVIESRSTNKWHIGIEETAPSYPLDTAGDIRAQGIFRSTELRDDSGYVEGLFGQGFVLKDDRDNTGRSYMELDDMRVRGQLRAHIFKKDIVRATNALLYVSDAAQTTEDVTTPSSTGSTFTLFVDTSVFQAGEEITFKDSSGGGITEVVGTVSSTNGSTTRGGQTVYELSVTLDFGTSATIPGGSTVVRTSGARMLLDASTADAPVQTLWNQSGNRRAAFGNLDGQYDFTAATFGMAAGDPNGNHITAEAGQGVRLRDGSSTLAQLNGTQLALGTSGQIVFDPTAGIEAQIKGTLRVSSGNIEAIDGSNEYRLNPAEPSEKFYHGGDLVAVFTSETNPSYGPTKTSDFFDASPSTPEFYNLSGGVFGGFAIVVRNADPYNSELVGWKAVDDDTGQTITSRTTTLSPNSTTTLSDTAKVDGVSTVRIEEAGTSSALIEEIDLEAFKPLTVISRRGVRVYKTSGTFDEL